MRLRSGDSKYVQNFGGENFWKLANWRTEKIYKDTIKGFREISTRCMELTRAVSNDSCDNEPSSSTTGLVSYLVSRSIGLLVSYQV